MSKVLRYMVCLAVSVSLSCVQFPVANSQESEEEIIVEEIVEDDEEVSEDVNVEEEITEEETADADVSEEVIEEVGEEAAATEEVEEVIEEPAAEESVTEVVTEKITQSPQEYYEYIIVKGDCLWFIAGRFYNDPFLWPEIHKANPYIKDPHWIYPDNKVVIPGIGPDGQPISGSLAQMASAVAVVADTAPAEETAVPYEEIPAEEQVAAAEEAPVEEEIVEEEAPADEFADVETVEDEIEEVAEEVTEDAAANISPKQRYVSSSFVAPLDWQFDGYVIGEESQKLMVSQGDDIYIDLGAEQGLKPRNRCIVYRAGRKVKDRTTKQVLGRVVRKIAVVEAGYDIEAEVATARVITSYDYIRPGDMVRMIKK